jgi:hypothetical protein
MDLDQYEDENEREIRRKLKEAYIKARELEEGWENVEYDPNGSHVHSNILLSGVVAGSVAGFATNSVELLAVNKQTNPNFSVRKFLRQKGSLSKLMFKGVGYRTIYYGSQACLMFYLLEEFKIYLKCEQFED